MKPKQGVGSHVRNKTFDEFAYAFQIFLTDRFTICEIVGRTVIVHSGPDDFTTQPSGNAGSKIACGQIRAVATR